MNLYAKLVAYVYEKLRQKERRVHIKLGNLIHRKMMMLNECPLRVDRLEGPGRLDEQEMFSSHFSDRFTRFGGSTSSKLGRGLLGRARATFI